MIDKKENSEDCRVANGRQETRAPPNLASMTSPVIRRKQSVSASARISQQNPVINLRPENRYEPPKKFVVKRSRLVTFLQIGEDWLYLASLGIIMALLSFSMDFVIALFLDTKLWLFQDFSKNNELLQYLGWSIMPIVLVTFSSGFVHLCSPTAIGSGIPEMKTILRGVVLNEYLTFRTLIAKVVGLTCTLGSGLPLGKEGPFVHMASIVATLLSKLVASFQGIYENESRSSEMLSAACAVGVAATFYAPIGGVLFSIEVTTVYFAVRNYWRGFFAACCGATIWRLLGFWIKNDESISALFKTNFRTDYPFDPIELLVFSFIGATCGLAGAGYIKFHREIVQFFRRHKKISGFLQKNRFVYPIFVTLIITTVTFPPLMGKYTAATLSTHTTIEHLFSNRTWSLGQQDIESRKILDAWTTPDTGFYLHLVLYIAMLFWTSALASTIPIPSGLFIPVLKMGAAYGRLIGELMHSSFPNGIRYGEYANPATIVPGSYAVVGAAAFSGAVTHTISTSVILFEMTGQIVHIIPVILGVLIANAVCQSLQPSIYDSIIEIKKLPYLPPIASSNSVSHKLLVKDFMNTQLAYVWKEKCTYNDLKSLLLANKKIIAFPLVESAISMKLLGSVARPDLLKLLYLHLGRERRLQEVYRRNSDTLAPNIHLLNTVSGRLTLGPSLSNQSNRSSVIEQPAGDCGLEMIIKPPIDEGDHHSNGGSSPDSGNSLDGFTPVIDLATRRGSMLLRQDLETSHSASDSENNIQRPKPVAKLVNHYNRGSSMDDELLEKSAQKIAQQLSIANKTPEMVILQTESSTSSSLEESSPVADQYDTPPTKRQLQQSPSHVTKRPLMPVVERRPIYNFNNTSLTAYPRAIPPSSPSLSLRPTKSILKSSSTMASLNSVYKRNISAASFSGTLDGINGTKSIGQQYSKAQFDIGSRSGIDNASSFALGEQPTSSTEVTPVRKRRKVRLPRLRVVDMTAEEQEQWEQDQLNAYIDITKCQIDEAPFQLVEQTSLYRVHTLFSMLGLNHAYVTSFGRLVGIVALKDIRFALEKILQE